LQQNFPNPFNPVTRINFAIPASGGALVPTMLILYNAIGQEVATLVHATLAPGYYGVELNAQPLSSGIYFYRLYSGQFSAVRKLVVLK
jgi:hypothetical protein